VIIFLAVKDGGYQAIPVTWQACGIFLLALLALCLVAMPAAGRPPRATIAAVALLAGYALWSYLSIAWAGQRADAWDGANRTALYAGVFALFALWPLGRRAATLLVGLLAAAIGVLAVVALVKVGAAANPRTYFINGRLGWPINYPNATVALWFIGFWPCIVLAGRREVHPLLRGAFLGIAGLLAGTGLLSQSRGWLFALPIATIVFLAIVPGRLRAAWALIAVGLSTLAIGSTVIDVHQAIYAERSPGPEIDAAVRAIVLAALLLAALGAAAGQLDRRVRVSAVTARRTGRATLAGAIVVVIAAFVLFVARVGDPVSWVDGRWQEFKSGPQPTAAGARFTQTLGSNRYDFWRVAWDEFTSNPVAGVGADNFRHDYLRARKSDEEPYYPHSLVIRSLSQTGLVGALLLFGAIGCAVASALAAIRGRPGPAGATAAAATAGFAYFLIHGAVDWFWELPALGGLAFAMLGIAAGLRPRRAVHPRSRRAREPIVRGLVPLAGVAVAAGLVLAATAPPLLAMVSAQRAVNGFKQSPANAPNALDLLDRAAALNPASALPRLLSAQIMVARGRPELAAPYYRDALARDPADEYSNLALGALESTAGRPAEAERLLRRAVHLSPRDELARTLLARVQRGDRIGIGDVNKDFVQRRENRQK
jgi:tetratricopeptide (TPR) repeat protein